MSVEYHLQDDVAEIKIIGSCSQNDLFDGFTNLLADEQLSSSTHLLINVGDSEILPPSEAIEQIAYIIGTGKGSFSGRVAVFVTKEVRYGIARQLSVYLESFDLMAKPFYQHTSAVDWLKAAGNS